MTKRLTGQDPLTSGEGCSGGSVGGGADRSAGDPVSEPVGGAAGGCVDGSTEGPMGRAARLPAMDDAMRVPLRCAAHGRTGDKGNHANISLIAWHPSLYSLLVDQVTEAVVTQVYRTRRPSHVARHLLPRLHAMNFVLDDVLDGGVNDALNLDSHGKALAFALLDLRVWVPTQLGHRLRNAPSNALRSSATPKA